MLKKMIIPRVAAFRVTEMIIKMLTVVGFIVNEVTIKVHIRDHVLL